VACITFDQSVMYSFLYSLRYLVVYEMCRFENR